MPYATLSEILGVFFKIGAFTIGGGYAMLPLVEDEMKRRKWISQAEMEDIIVLAQSAPGIFAVNLAIYAGHRLRGTKGSISAAIGAVLPSFIIILLVAMVFSGFRDNPVVVRIFHGIRPVAVALILVPAIRLARSSCRKWWAVLTAFSVLFLVAFLRVSPVWIVVTIIAVVASVSCFKHR